MARTAKNQETSRLSLELATTVKTRLEELRDEVGADTLTEVIRRALALYDYATTAKRKGGELVIRTNGQDKTVEFF